MSETLDDPKRLSLLPMPEKARIFLAYLEYGGTHQFEGRTLRLLPPENGVYQMGAEVEIESFSPPGVMRSTIGLQISFQRFTDILAGLTYGDLVRMEQVTSIKKGGIHA